MSRAYSWVSVLPGLYGLFFNWGKKGIMDRGKPGRFGGPLSDLKLLFGIPHADNCQAAYVDDAGPQTSFLVFFLGALFLARLAMCAKLRRKRFASRSLTSRSGVLFRGQRG
jgi:hypothetical protein